MRSGRLPGGTALPSSRSLAGDLGVARNTVASAYTQLVSEGWLAARQGRGTWVADHRAHASTSQPPNEPDLPLRYNLNPGVPDLSTFPRAEWAKAAQRALGTLPDTVFGYGDPRGLETLRSELVEYLGRVRGVYSSPDNIVVTSGATQGLFLVSQALAAKGVRIAAVENASFPVQRLQLENAGFQLAPLMVDEDGGSVEELVNSNADTVLLTPAHQFPWGVSLSPFRRDQVLTWARGAQSYIIEDDYDGEFRYDRRPVGALQGLAPDTVIYIGSVSKSLAPGLRLGWLVMPPDLLDEVVALRRRIDLHTGVFEQFTLAEMIRSGGYDRHIRRCRIRYRNRRDHLLKKLGNQAPHIEVSGINAGLHVLITLSGDLEDERAIVSNAARHGLGLAGLDQFRHSSEPKLPGGLVVGYGASSGHSYNAAVNLLCRLLQAEQVSDS